MNTLKILEPLNCEQKDAVTAPPGPIAIIAGPGCGKTKTITHKIAYRVQNNLCASNATLVLTFAQKAARNIEYELEKLGIAGIQVYTFHAFALQMLRLFWDKTASNFPYIEENKEKLLFRILIERNIQDKMFTKYLSRHIERRKALNLSPWEYLSLEEDTSKSGKTHSQGNRELLLELMLDYENYKFKENIFDFEDVLLAFAGMLESEAEVIHLLQEKYTDFFVDEYQDISTIQHIILHLLLQKKKNLCVVGDPAQCIYSFAGSNTEFLLNFQQEFPDAKVIQLTRNYRSSKNILTFANSIAKHIKGAVQISSQSPLGQHVQILQFATYHKEAEGIIKWVMALEREGIAIGQMAVLVRTVKQQEFLISFLLKRGIPSGKSTDAASTSSSLLTIATIHSSKGLEWEAVWVAGLNEGILPYSPQQTPDRMHGGIHPAHKNKMTINSKSQESEGKILLDEERRLFYVATTRAKTRLVMSFSRNMGAVSRFIKETGMSISNERQYQKPKVRRFA